MFRIQTICMYVMYAQIPKGAIMHRFGSLETYHTHNYIPRAASSSVQSIVGTAPNTQRNQSSLHRLVSLETHRTRYNYILKIASYLCP
jgi:hypothetical protein